jgi:hypothetical protein
MLDWMQEKGAPVVFIEKFKKTLSYQKWTQNEMFFKIFFTIQGPQCRAEILVKTRSELSACGTSILRPEAAAHKVHNASRKPKEVVVEELWQHYLQCHPKDFETEARWVGNVIDEDEEGAKK